MNRAARALALAFGVSAPLALAIAVSVMTSGVALGKAGGTPAIPLNSAQETGAVTSAGSGFFSYTVSGNDMLNAWYGAWVDDFANADGEGLMKQASEAAHQE